MRLLLADDHVLFREALIQLIVALRPNWTIVSVSDFEGAYDQVTNVGGYDMVLLDMRMPGMNGLKGLEKIRESYPDQYVSILSGVAEERHVKNAMEMGARAYFPKTLSGKVLVKAIELVTLSDQKFVPMDETGVKIMPAYYDDGDFPHADDVEPAHDFANKFNLTRREIEVLSHLAEGLSNKAIAENMDIQVTTVKLHVGGVCKKMQVENRTQAAIKAHKLGLIATASV